MLRRTHSVVTRDTIWRFWEHHIVMRLARDTLQPNNATGKTTNLTKQNLDKIKSICKMQEERDAASLYEKEINGIWYELADEVAILLTIHALSHIAGKTAMVNQLETCRRRNFRLTSDKLSQEDFAKYETAIKKNMVLSRGRVGIKENTPDYNTDDDFKNVAPDNKRIVMHTKPARGRGAKTKRRETERIMAQKIYMEKISAEYEKNMVRPMKVAKKKTGCTPGKGNDKEGYVAVETKGDHVGEEEGEKKGCEEEEDEEEEDEDEEDEEDGEEEKKQSGKEFGAHQAKLDHILAAAQEANPIKAGKRVSSSADREKKTSRRARNCA